MHELSICLALISQVNRIAREQNAHRADRIVVKIGPLSGVEPDLLRSAFPLAATGTVAEKARLVIETTPVVVHCTRCSEDSEVSPNRLICPRCGDFRTHVTVGEDMVLQTLELCAASEPDSGAVAKSSQGNV